MPKKCAPEIRRQVIELAQVTATAAQLAKMFLLPGTTNCIWPEEARINCGADEVRRHTSVSRSPLLSAGSGNLTPSSRSR
jgi:hypothetical protein